MLVGGQGPCGAVGADPQQGERYCVCRHTSSRLLSREPVALNRSRKQPLLCAPSSTVSRPRSVSHRLPSTWGSATRPPTDSRPEASCRSRLCASGTATAFRPHRCSNCSGSLRSPLQTRLPRCARVSVRTTPLWPSRDRIQQRRLRRREHPVSARSSTAGQRGFPCTARERGGEASWLVLYSKGAAAGRWCPAPMDGPNPARSAADAPNWYVWTADGTRGMAAGASRSASESPPAPSAAVCASSTIPHGHRLPAY